MVAGSAPRVNTPAYYYNFFEFVFSAKCVLVLSEKEQNKYSRCSAFASSALLHIFFNSNPVDFVGWGTKNISWPGCRVP